MSGFDPNDDVVEVIEPSGAARWHQCRRAVLIDQQWPAARLLGVQLEAAQYGCCPHAALPTEIGIAHTAAEAASHRTIAARHRGGEKAAVRYARENPDIDDLHRVGVCAVTVGALVLAREDLCNSRRRCPWTGQLDRQWPAYLASTACSITGDVVSRIMPLASWASVLKALSILSSVNSANGELSVLTR